MPEDEPTLDRTVRMVDFGLDEAEITFDLGEPPSEAELEEAEQFIEQLMKE